MGRLQKYPKIHVSTGEESSGTGTHSTQYLRPQHRRERNPERPPSNSNGDWPFLRPLERVPEVPVVCREHLPQLEKIQGVLYSWRDEGHFRRGVSRLITPNLFNLQRVLHTLAATQEVPRHTRLHSRGSTRVPPTSRGSLDPREGKRDTAATAREESPRACTHSRRGLTPLGRLQKYPKIHVSTGEESSGSRNDSTQGLRTQHRRKRNPRGTRATRMGTGLS